MFARTERLLLRPGWGEDAPALARAIGDEAIVRNLATAPWPYGLEDAQAFLAAERQPGETPCLIFRRTRGAPQLIGSAGLGHKPDGTVELGYWISRPHWGLGYATEAAEAVLGFARHSLRLRGLTARHFVDNPASGRVLEKLGFHRTGIVEPSYSAGRRTVAPARFYTLDLGSPAVTAGELEAGEAVTLDACRMMAA